MEIPDQKSALVLGVAAADGVRKVPILPDQNGGRAFVLFELPRFLIVEIPDQKFALVLGVPAADGVRKVPILPDQSGDRVFVLFELPRFLIVEIPDQKSTCWFVLREL